MGAGQPLCPINPIVSVTVPNRLGPARPTLFQNLMDFLSHSGRKVSYVICLGIVSYRVRFSQNKHQFSPQCKVLSNVPCYVLPVRYLI
jgi:hypothetical protein